VVSSQLLSFDGLVAGRASGRKTLCYKTSPAALPPREYGGFSAYGGGRCGVRQVRPVGDDAWRECG